MDSPAKSAHLSQKEKKKRKKKEYYIHFYMLDFRKQTNWQNVYIHKRLKRKKIKCKKGQSFLFLSSLSRFVSNISSENKSVMSCCVFCFVKKRRRRRIKLRFCFNFVFV